MVKIGCGQRLDNHVFHSTLNGRVRRLPLWGDIAININAARFDVPVPPRLQDRFRWPHEVCPGILKL